MFAFTFNYSYGINLLDKIFAAIRIYLYLFLWKLFNIISIFYYRYTCSNFKFYDHKIKEHGPTIMAIVNNTNLKRAPHSPEPRDHPSKYIKIDHDFRGEKRNRVNSIDKPAKYIDEYSIIKE